MSLADLDPVIHAPKRLAIMSVLVHSSSTDFPFLKEHLGVSDSDLSKQMSALQQAGYVDVTRSRGRGSTTTYRVTRSGRTAFQRHVAALQAVVADPAAEPAAGPAADRAGRAAD